MNRLCITSAGSARLPQLMAGCRNLALTLMRCAGATNIAAVLRTYTGRPAAAVALVLTGGWE